MVGIDRLCMVDKDRENADCWLQVEPIIGGRISGPAINATVKGGVAYPNVFDNGNLQDAFITTYGTTREGEAFLVQVVGVGKPSEQFSRIVSLWIVLPLFGF